jgi:hypothetical protein
MPRYAIKVMPKVIDARSTTPSAQVGWSRQRFELSDFSTAPQSEPFDTDSESDPAQG